MTRAKDIIDDMMMESWIGNTVIPELQDMVVDGADISTRQKAIEVLVAYKDKKYNKIIKWLESLEDKEYAKFYKQWL